MPKVELYIENQLMDLSGDESIEVDYKLMEVNKLESRGSARSYTFELPKSNTNKTILESPEVINNLSTKPYNKLSARCYVDGVDSQIRFAAIEEISDFYVLRLYGVNADFFFDAKDVFLGDLNWCEYDHYWCFDNIQNSWSNTDGYIYPVIDYHKDSPNTIIDNVTREIDARYMLPSVFLHTVFEKIADYFQIDIINEVANHEDYPAAGLLLPYSGKELVRDKNNERYEATFSLSQDTAMDTPLPDSPGVSYGTWLYFDEVTNNCGEYWTEGNFEPRSFGGGTNIKLDFAEKARFTLDYNLIITCDTDISLSIVLTTYFTAVLNPSVMTDTNTEFIIEDFVAGQTKTISGTVILETNDEVTWLTSGEDYLMLFTGAVPFIVTLNAGSYITIRDVEILEEGEIIYNNAPLQKNYMPISSILPEWSCAELIKIYCQMTCSMPVYSREDKTLTIKPFDAVLSNLTNAVDYSEKIDTFESPLIKFEYLETAQINNFKYQDDSDVVKPEDTDGEINIANENLEAETDAVVLPFGACERNNRLIDIPVIKIGYWDEEGQQKTATQTDRILILRYVDSADFDNTTALTVSDGTDSFNSSTNIPLPYFIDTDEDFNLGFGNNLLANYFEVIENIWQNTKVVTVAVRLSAADISNLDFFKPVFIGSHESYYYVNMIKGFSLTENKSTLVELVKLNING